MKVWTAWFIWVLHWAPFHKSLSIFQSKWPSPPLISTEITNNQLRESRLYISPSAPSALITWSNYQARYYNCLSYGQLLGLSCEDMELSSGSNLLVILTPGEDSWSHCLPSSSYGSPGWSPGLPHLCNLSDFLGCQGAGATMASVPYKTGTHSFSTSSIVSQSIEVLRSWPFPVYVPSWRYILWIHGEQTHDPFLTSTLLKLNR